MFQAKACFSQAKYEKIHPWLDLSNWEETNVRYAYALRISAILILGSLCAQGSMRGFAESASQAAPSKELTPDQIIQKFAEKETEFYEAWMQYSYRQTAVVRVLSVDGAPRKESLTIIYEVVFNDDGTREVQILRRSGRLNAVGFSPEDEDVLLNLNPFALTAKELPLYDLKYQGKEKVDELNCYVFSVKPIKIKKDKLFKYFDGKIWIDDLDLQIVRTVGTPVPQDKNNKIPEFETLRQVIDNKYWFPVWTHADSRLYFSNQTVRIEETITYEDYKKFGSKSSIRFESPGAPEEK